MGQKGKRVWLIRHAESQAQTNEFIGIDAPLSKLGTLQAEQLKLPLSGIKFDAIFLSPLKRARQTYEYSGIDAEKVFFDSRLIEDMPQGAYQAILPYEELPAYGIPDNQNAWNIKTEERARSFISTLYSTEYKRILVISHSAFFSIFLKELIEYKSSEKNFYLGTNNCGISSILFPSEETPILTILFWNDISHVRNLLGYDPMKY
ncbi:MAG TPA: phosphoglycerate mutase family protein [Victivallales bacterium]|nr:phosphoglycerate mutase family protein [Victivallales bacterium]HPO89931.1 phosphoglycerate mutase family protein [Victivallales bacterium]HRR05747.1 phosphoglycerate mutase family protein [Victivallales bacterium]HRR29566.1 phosphoglycerate mutase family protein [Victivallales bacterium]HRU01496.1 phosphoglycerate mutase family protein [Victivallales bacterium]